MDDKNGNRLRLERDGPTFSNFDAISIEIPKNLSRIVLFKTFH